jgi:hypothetical protein
MTNNILRPVPRTSTLGMMPQHPAPTRTKPSDVQLIQAIMHSFAVSEWEAFGWISAMDIDATSDELIDLDRARLPVKSMPWGHLIASSWVAA